MESNQSLFSLAIDPVTKEHLGETAKWARFLAITGMIFLVLGIIFGLSGIWFTSMMTSTETAMVGPTDMAGVFVAAYMFVIAVVWFFPLMFLLRYSNRMRAALGGNDQQALNVAFQNLKMCMRYVGIVTIILLALTLIGIVFSVMTIAAMS